MTNEDQQHLNRLLRLKTRRLQTIEEQLATLGVRSDPSLVMEADDIREEIQSIQEQISTVEFYSANEQTMEALSGSPQSIDGEEMNVLKNEKVDDSRVDLSSFMYFIHEIEPIMYWFNSSVPAEHARKYFSCLQRLFYSSSDIIYFNGDKNIIMGNELLLRVLGTDPFEPSNNSVPAFTSYLYFSKEYASDTQGEECKDSTHRFFINSLEKMYEIKVEDFDMYLNYVFLELSDIFKKINSDGNERTKPIRIAVAMLQYYKNIWDEGRYLLVPLNISMEIQRVISLYFEKQLNIATPNEFDEMRDLRSLCYLAWDEIRG